MLRNCDVVGCAYMVDPMPLSGWGGDVNVRCTQQIDRQWQGWKILCCFPICIRKWKQVKAKAVTWALLWKGAVFPIRLAIKTWYPTVAWSLRGSLGTGSCGSDTWNYQATCSYPYLVVSNVFFIFKTDPWQNDPIWWAFWKKTKRDPIRLRMFEDI